jgi:hypothetical protein
MSNSTIGLPPEGSYQFPGLGAPDVDALVERSRREELPVRGERHRVDRLLVSRQGVEGDAPLDVPESDGRIKRGGGLASNIAFGSSLTKRTK